MAERTMKLPVYLSLVAQAERTLESPFVRSPRPRDEPDVHFLCRTLADQCDEHALGLSR